jgi:hypothetical protein
MKTLIAALALMLSSNTAIAETYYATVTKVVPVYGEVVRNVPQQRCNYVMAPIYGTVRGHDGRRVVAVTGFQREYQCQAIMEKRIVMEINHYYVTYHVNGTVGKTYTRQNYHVGDKILVTFSIER